jgi:Tol biopolymer transport system component
VSPDGKRIAFATLGTPGYLTLSIHSLESSTTTEMPQVRQPSSIAWSPDSGRIAFGTQARRFGVLDMAAGSIQSSFEGEGTLRGVAWGNDRIVFAADLAQGGALFSVSPAGGQPRQIMARPNARVAQPVFVDGGRSLVYLVTDDKQQSRVCVSDTDGSERGCVALAALSIGYSETGHLLFSRNSRSLRSALTSRKSR